MYQIVYSVKLSLYKLNVSTGVSLSKSYGRSTCGNIFNRNVLLKNDVVAIIILKNGKIIKTIVG